MFRKYLPPLEMPKVMANRFFIKKHADLTYIIFISSESKLFFISIIFIPYFVTCLCLFSFSLFISFVSCSIGMDLLYRVLLHLVWKRSFQSNLPLSYVFPSLSFVYSFCWLCLAIHKLLILLRSNQWVFGVSIFYIVLKKSFPTMGL